MTTNDQPQTIPADKVRAARDLHRDAAKMVTITDAEREIHQHVADAMEALLPSGGCKPTIITITRVNQDEVGDTDDFDYEVMDDQTEFLWREGTPEPPPDEYAPDEGRYTDANGVEWRRFDDAWFRESTDTVALVDDAWRGSVFEEVGPLGPKVGEKFYLWTDRYDFYSAFVSHVERAPKGADQ